MVCTGKLGWAVVGSVVLHIGLAAILWPPIPPSIVSRYPFVIQTKLIFDTPHTALVLSAEPSIAPSVPATSRSASAPQSAVTAYRPETLGVAPVLELELELPKPPEPTGYLPIDAVDQAAIPLTDWTIDTEVLPRGYTLRLSLQLWISASGTLDRWEILGDTANPALAHKALAHLNDTPIQPALLNQIAVPSFRQLEVVVTRD